MTGEADAVSEDRRGLVCAVGCYALWGILPLYFSFLHNVGPVELVAQRIIWSLLLLIAILALRGMLPTLVQTLRNGAVMRALLASSIFIACNWLTYVWAVHSGHVVAASLGYFLNPLVNILLGMMVLGERLRRTQWLAVGFAAAGVAILAAAALNTLWISLALGTSFGLYGLIRKLTPVPPMAGLAVETLLLFPLSFAYTAWLAVNGHMAFGSDATTTTLIMLLSVITAAPLVLFAMAAQRLSLAALGVIQYIAPSLQFLTGVLLFGERLNAGQLASFGLIWIGLVIFTADMVHASRRPRAVVA